MNELDYFLLGKNTSAVNYEIVHNLIFSDLLAEKELQELILGEALENAYQVEREYVGGLFDIALLQDNEPVAVIELKVVSGLHKGQIERQLDYIKKTQEGLLIYCLIGVSGVENLAWHELKMHEEPFVRRFTTVDLLRFFENVKRDIWSDAKRGLFNSYKNALERQWDYFENAYGNETANDYFRYLSFYHHVSKALTDSKVSTHIYSLNNRAGISYILNVYNSWLRIQYKGFKFRLFHELNASKSSQGAILHEVKLYSEPNPSMNWKKKELARLIIDELSAMCPALTTKPQRVSKYMILFRTEIGFIGADQIYPAADFLVSIHKSIQKVKDLWPS